MELTKYLTKEKIAALADKGVSESDLIEKINSYKVDYADLEYTEEELENTIKGRINIAVAKILSSKLLQYKGIVLSIKQPRDEYKFLRDWVNNHLGEKRQDGWIVQEGLIPWGNQEGDPIPEGSLWKQQVSVGVDNKGKLEVKEIVLEGDWVNNKEVNTITVGDVITFKSSEKFFDYKTSTIYAYNKAAPLEESVWETLLNGGLKPFVKTIKEVIDGDYRGFAIVKCNVGDLDRTQSGYSFMIYDNSFSDEEQFEPENIIQAYMRQVNFVEGAHNIVCIGDIYSKDTSKTFNISKAIVPDKFKRVEITEETSKIIESDIEDVEETVEEDSGVDLL